MAAVLVLALSLLSASPELHAWLHGADHGHAAAHAESASGRHHGAVQVSGVDDDGCVVVLFARGITGGLCLVLTGLFIGRVIAFFRSCVERLGIRAPRYWLPPMCGPPAA
jgi:hypothetical protein